MGPSTILQTQQQHLTAAASTSSAAFATLLTLALGGSTAGSKFLFNLSASFVGTAAIGGPLAVDTQYQIVIDGVPQPAAGVVTTGGLSGVAAGGSVPGTAAMTLQVPNPGAGAHTILVQWKLSAGLAGDTATIDPTVLGNGQHASLTLIETTV